MCIRDRCTRWLLRDEKGCCIGRVASFIDKSSCHLDSYSVGGMGFFECINDQEAAFMLFDRCRVWLEERGMAVSYTHLVENPNKLHQELSGLNKKMKLGLKTLSPDEVKSWFN